MNPTLPVTERTSWSLPLSLVSTNLPAVQVWFLTSLLCCFPFAEFCDRIGMRTSIPLYFSLFNSFLVLNLLPFGTFRTSPSIWKIINSYSWGHFKFSFLTPTSSSDYFSYLHLVVLVFTDSLSGALPILLLLLPRTRSSTNCCPILTSTCLLTKLWLILIQGEAAKNLLLQLFVRSVTDCQPLGSLLGTRYKTAQGPMWDASVMTISDSCCNWPVSHLHFLSLIRATKMNDNSLGHACFITKWPAGGTVQLGFHPLRLYRATYSKVRNFYHAMKSEVAVFQNYTHKKMWVFIRFLTPGPWRRLKVVVCPCLVLT